MSKGLKIIKGTLLFLIIFLVLFLVTPMIVFYAGCIGGSDSMEGCVGGIVIKLVFPVYRTAACELWHKAACSQYTLLPGWYDSFFNLFNAVVIVGVAGFSIWLSKKLIASRT